MSILVVGNSHIVGFISAAKQEEYDASMTFIPIPLCADFEQVIRSDGNVFNLKTGWENMNSDVGKKETQIQYDIATVDTLVIVGMKLFGAYPTLAALFTPTTYNEQEFLICPYADMKTIPSHVKYKVVSEACLREVFINTINESLAELSWLTSKFKKVFWVPSPVPNIHFVSEKALLEHKWYINSGLHYRHLSIFNTSLLKVNESTYLNPGGVKFFQHPLQCVEKGTGFLKESFAFAPDIQDIHASSAFYTKFLNEIVA